MNDLDRKRQLLIELARARAAMTRQGAGVRAGLDVSGRLKESVRSNPVPWVVGGVVVAGAFVLLVGSRRQATPAPANVWRDLSAKYGPPREEVLPTAAKTGVALAAITAAVRWLLPIFRPLLVTWISQRVSAHVSRGDPPPRPR